MIDRIGQKVEANNEMINAVTKKLDRLTEKTEDNAAAIDALTNRGDRLTEQIGRATEMFIDSLGVIREMQSEIRGLQVENRRIIDRVFGEDN